MTIMEKVLALNEVELFSHMTTEELSILASIAEEVHLGKGDPLIEENSPADSLQLVLSGKVRVTRGGQVIFDAGANETLGALSLMDGEPWAFGADILEPTEVLRIDRETFLDVLSDHTGMTDAILRSLVTKVRRLVDTPVSGPPAGNSATNREPNDSE